jgi:hypothetical protein
MMRVLSLTVAIVAAFAAPPAVQPQSTYRIGFLSESAVLVTLVDRSDVCVPRLLGGSGSSATRSANRIGATSTGAAASNSSR